MHKNNQIKFFLVPILLLLALIVLILGTAFFFTNKFEQQVELTRENKRQLIQLEKEQERIRDLETVAKEVRKNWDRIDKLFVDSDVPLEFVRFIENLANQNNLNAEISSVREHETKQGQIQLSFVVNLEGNFIDMTTFLVQLENAPYLIEIEQFQIEANTKQNMNLTLSVLAK